MVEALVISREECAKRDMFAQEDEFCLLIASYRNGAKNVRFSNHPNPLTHQFHFRC